MNKAHRNIIYFYSISNGNDKYSALNKGAIIQENA